MTDPIANNRPGRPSGEAPGSEFLHGFKPLKTGRIHLKCPTCKRKMSNSPRAEDDPPKAALMVTECQECASGHFDDPTYYDAAGKEL